MRIGRVLDLRKRIERIIASFLVGFEEQGGEVSDVITPPGDSFLDGNMQRVFLDTPALDERSVTLSIRDNNLIFQAQKVSGNTEHTLFLHMSRSSGTYMKVIPLAFEAETCTGFTTAYSDGVLRITVTFGR